MSDSVENTQQLITSRLRESIYPMQGVLSDFDPLLSRIEDAHFVLIGEATHGTQEFYNLRAEITKRLIQEKGFNIVAAEADWPDAYRVNRFVQGRSNDENSRQALSDFERFPVWMWRNTVVRDFATWLRDYNASQSDVNRRCGFYGLDLYSLNASIEAVINYLDEVDPEAAQRARYRYACFDHFGEDPQTYGYAASFDLTPSCEQEVVEQLVELRQQAFNYLHRDGFVAQDEYFYAEQNARIAKNAEEYYRSMFTGRVPSWNLRDRHMVQTLRELVEHVRKQGKEPKAVLWEHNSHLGDARATDMTRRGEVNVGQLVREQYGEDAVLIGFTTYSGTVTAASDWGAPYERKTVRPALPGSFEWLFHSIDVPRFSLLLDNAQESLADLQRDQLERAIGVIYLPETERISHYFYARLMDQFNAVMHIDHTHALQPLERTELWERGEEGGEVPETYPSGL